jgi:hypothetical protein
MDKHYRITVVDDNARSDPFYPALVTRLRTDLLQEPEIIWLDADSLHPDPKLTVGEIRQARPDLILLDVILHEGGGRPDLVLCDWLTKEIQADPALQAVPLIYVSRFFGDHYAVPAPWRRWCFAKQTLISDEEAWSLFKESLRDLPGAARQQSTLNSLPRMLMSESLNR